MSTYSTTTLINKALVLCGANTVSDITDDTPNARALNTVYDIARKSILTECKWTFSTTRTTLATVATSTFAWLHQEEAYAYDRPTDALRIWEVSNSTARWREEGAYILADTGSLGAKWTYDVEDVSLFRPKFVAAFIDKLGADISFTILNSTPKAEAFIAKYEKITLPAAKTENSQTGFQQEVNDSEWEAAKLSNGGNQARSYS